MHVYTVTMISDYLGPRGNAHEVVLGVRIFANLELADEFLAKMETTDARFGYRRRVDMHEVLTSLNDVE